MTMHHGVHRWRCPTASTDPGLKLRQNPEWLVCRRMAVPQTRCKALIRMRRVPPMTSTAGAQAARRARAALVSGHLPAQRRRRPAPAAQRHCLASSPRSRRGTMVAPPPPAPCRPSCRRPPCPRCMEMELHLKSNSTVGECSESPSVQG